MDISIMVEGQQGLTWPRWKALAQAVDGAGFAGLYRSDHFTDAAPPSQDSLELVVSLAYLADRTEHIRFGPCVAPVSFRDPVMFARQAQQLDDLSGGRMVLGLGAGWQAREHTMFGYPLGDVATRMARFEEGLAVAHALLRGDGPASYAGQFFTLREAELLPKPQHPGGPRIMVGGNGMKRTLALTARYADIWNGVFLTPAGFRERSERLGELLVEHGRAPDAVRRTMMTALHLGRDTAELRAAGNQVFGTADEVLAQLRAYAEAGVAEIFLQWFDLDDLDGLRRFAEAVVGKV